MRFFVMHVVNQIRCKGLSLWNKAMNIGTVETIMRLYLKMFWYWITFSMRSMFVLCVSKSHVKTLLTKPSRDVWQPLFYFFSRRFSFKIIHDNIFSKARQRYVASIDLLFHEVLQSILFLMKRGVEYIYLVGAMKVLAACDKKKKKSWWSCYDGLGWSC